MSATITTTVEHPFLKTTRTIFAVEGTGVVISADEHEEYMGRVEVRDGPLAVLSFEHPNPLGAARSIAVLLSQGASS